MKIAQRVFIDNKDKFKYGTKVLAKINNREYFGITLYNDLIISGNVLVYFPAHPTLNNGDLARCSIEIPIKYLVARY